MEIWGEEEGEGEGLDGKTLGEGFVPDSLKGETVLTLLALIVVLNRTQGY